MKSFALLLCLLLVVGVHSFSIHYPVGTKLFFYDNGYKEWQNGEILEYDADTEIYKIKWEDGRIADSSSYTETQLYDMAENYEALWPIGTEVYHKVNSTWMAGTITTLTKYGDYAITWSSGVIEVDQYSDDQIDEMVTDYMLHKDQDGRIPVGTRVYFFDQSDSAWDEGIITKWTPDHGYTIEWEDGTTEVGKYNDHEMHEMVDNYKGKSVIEDSEPVPAGTGVYQFDPLAHSWYAGVITKHSPQLGYTIVWESEAIEVAQYTPDEVRQMVLNYMNKDHISADTKLIPIGTKLQWRSDDGTDIKEGKIKKWTPMDGYSVEWDDGRVEEGVYSLSEIEKMAQQYRAADSDHWPIGTGVYQKYQNGWREGSIIGWNKENSYTITWSDDSIETDVYSEHDINEMVKNNHLLNDADSPYLGNTFAVGTHVYLDYDDEWYEGVISSYDPDTGYNITWSDGSTQVNLYTREELQQMIDNWNAKRPPSGMTWNSSSDSNSTVSGVAIFFLIVAIIGPLGIIIRKHYFPRDDRERKEAEHTVTFPDPMLLPNPNAFS